MITSQKRVVAENKHRHCEIFCIAQDVQYTGYKWNVHFRSKPQSWWGEKENLPIYKLYISNYVACCVM